MEKQKNNKLGTFFILLVTTFLSCFAVAHAQTATPTITTSGIPSLIAPTTSVTTTPTVTATVVATPTPTQPPKIEAVATVATVGTQYPWNKKIPIKFSIKPSQSGSKLEIRWQKKAGLVGSPVTTTISNPQAGKTYVVSFTLTPYAPGFQRAVADIILTTDTTNYVTSKDIPVQLDIKKVVLPVTMTYRAYQVVMYLVIFLLFFVALPYVAYQVYLYIKKYVIPKWLESKIQHPV